MAVVSGDLPVYGSIIKRVFPQYGIPYFIDEKKTHNAKPHCGLYTDLSAGNKPGLPLR